MTINKITSAPTPNEQINKINEIIDNLGSGGVNDVQINGTSIVSSGSANIITNTAYNSSTNKIATMSDIPAAQVQANWNETNTSSKAYIQNKPTIPTYNFHGVDFYSTNSTNVGAIGGDCNTLTSNGHYYYTSNGPNGLGEQSTDGALYVQAYSNSWVVQIAQDYRTGNLFTRSKNNGSWTAWKAVGGSEITITYDV